MTLGLYPVFLARVSWLHLLASLAAFTFDTSTWILGLSTPDLLRLTWQSHANLLPEQARHNAHVATLAGLDGSTKFLIGDSHEPTQSRPAPENGGRPPCPLGTGRHLHRRRRYLRPAEGRCDRRLDHPDRECA